MRSRIATLTCWCCCAGRFAGPRIVETCIHALYPLVLELERPIDVRPVDGEDYRTQRLPLYFEASKEGVAV